MKRALSSVALLLVLGRPLIAQNPAPAPAPAPTQTPTTPTAPVNAPATRTAAQDAAAAMGKNVSNAEIANAIKNSGLSEAQVRARLQASGYDPKLADPFFSGGMTSGVGTRATSDPGFVSALQTLGILNASDASETTSETDDADPDRRNVDRSARTEGANQVFGRSIFKRGTTSFDPAAGGAIDASYRLGSGDQLQFIVTGDMEMAASPEVRRDGTIVLPQIGQVSVSGLTLEAARAAIRNRAAQVFSIIAAGKARIDLTVTRVRNNQVFVIGEVESPGSYQVNALGTAFRALVAAGGPTPRGTFRNIEVRRGGAVVAHADLYDYLLRGDASNDVRLQQGDIVFVGLNRRAVAVQGAVRRPGIYELRDGEKFSDLLTFVGDLLPTAATDRILIDRILPPEQRTPGRERAFIDVPFNGRKAVLDSIQLYDNDVVSVFAVGDMRRNRVTLAGAVFQPGTYEWNQGMTLSELIDKAQGFLPTALTDRVKLERTVIATGRTEVININAQDSSWRRFPVQEFDEIVVLDARRAFPTRTVRIAGSVMSPGIHPYKEHQSLRDLIDMSGGFTAEAAIVDLARRRVGTTYSDTSTVNSSFAIQPDGRLAQGADSIVLEPLDEVNVRATPGVRGTENVLLSGPFTYPGTYVLRRDGERVSEVVRRAGGLLPSAYPKSARLTRKGQVVAFDLQRALGGDKEHDIALADGDQLAIGPDPSTVSVSGAVERQVVIPFRRDWGVEDYIAAAGGYADRADRGNVIIEYPSGELLRRRTGRFTPTRDARVISGSNIVVGRRAEEAANNNNEVVTRSLQILTTMVSVFLAYKTAVR